MSNTMDEKASSFDAPKSESTIIATSIVEDNVKASDGDDALKLAGTHAHQFDEKYYLRLRRKIVSHYGSNAQSQQRD